MAALRVLLSNLTPLTVASRTLVGLLIGTMSLLRIEAEVVEGCTRYGAERTKGAGKIHNSSNRAPGRTSQARAPNRLRSLGPEKTRSVTKRENCLDGTVYFQAEWQFTNFNQEETCPN
jgi:hypothetical protein